MTHNFTAGEGKSWGAVLRIKIAALLPRVKLLAERFYATRNKFIISAGHNKSFRDLRNRAPVPPRFIFVHALEYTLANSILITAHDKFSSKSPSAPGFVLFTRTVYSAVCFANRVFFSAGSHGAVYFAYRLLRAQEVSARSLCGALCRPEKRACHFNSARKS